MTSTHHTAATELAEPTPNSTSMMLADFGKFASLPMGIVVPIEFMPGGPGEHEFTCQMGMLRGRIIVEAA